MRHKSTDRKHKSELLHEASALLGYYRKAAVRALNAKAARLGPPKAPAIVGLPREFSPDKLLPIHKPIWFAALQPCGRRLHALLPEWAARL